MKKVVFSKATFLKAALSPESWPTIHAPSGGLLPEIAFVGRSNVGKSSLINHLLKKKYLAKVSDTPGKTQTLNFFNVDDQIALVDLPGYGYAKAPPGMREKWAKSIDAYLEKRSSLALILLLLDIRRVPTVEDIAFVQWAAHFKKPLLIIFTKTDKVKAQERQRNTKRALEIFVEEFPYLHYSIKDAKSRPLLIETINKLLSDHGTHS